MCHFYNLHNPENQRLFVNFQFDKLILHEYNKDVYTLRITNADNPKLNGLSTLLRKCDLINNKHIPHIYKCNSRENRLKLLAGILDADGSYDRKKKTFEFSQSLEHEQIMDDVIYLCRSLGFTTYKHVKQTSWIHNGVKKFVKAFRININGQGIHEIPTLIKRKQAQPRKECVDTLTSQIKIEEIIFTTDSLSYSLSSKSLATTSWSKHQNI